MNDAVLTETELAERWKMSVGTLRQWRYIPKPNHPKFIKIGRLVRYPLAEIERFEKNLTSHDTIDTEPTPQTAPKTLDDSVIDNWQGTGL